ncbi:MAG TPA: primosomal protein N', partial [candidate division Zixibacteria bacterium]|nr:primosomal protein N' [candidate division Zixibacteria bacterium]
MGGGFRGRGYSRYRQYGCGRSHAGEYRPNKGPGGGFEGDCRGHRKSRYETSLLWGVTGSGKTEVYLNATEYARKSGKGVLVLVPEIALTPLLRQRFEQRFPGEIAILHSGLKPGERFDSWRRLLSGDLKIAIGPRSAIFAPVQNLGLIIVDEEHETSYKQDEPPPYYNARDTAVMRGHIESCPVVLGTATPSSESYQNARDGKYKMLRIPERVPGAELPAVRIVDMASEHEEQKNFSPFSNLLREKLVETISSGHRAMLLLNRRGYSSYLQCQDCGFIPTCDDCGIGLTYHSVDKTLRCHYCGHEERPSDKCPNCGNSEFLFRGRGTQRIEEELEELVPPEKIFRLDADTARWQGHAGVLAKYSKTQGAVLIGTQMIAKGHDFPDVSLVGVLNADIGLAIPDFRSGERIFQLLTQVSGRAGRSDIRGEVIIQTYRPDSAAVDFSVNGDVESFFEIELKAREELRYPPFGRMLRVIIRGEDPSEVRTSIFRLTRELARIDREGNKYRLLGPASCPLTKLRGKYRWHLLLKTERLGTSVTIVKRLLSNMGGDIDFKLIVDPIT